MTCRPAPQCRISPAPAFRNGYAGDDPLAAALSLAEGQPRRAAARGRRARVPARPPRARPSACRSSTAAPWMHWPRKGAQGAGGAGGARHRLRTAARRRVRLRRVARRRVRRRAAARGPPRGAADVRHMHWLSLRFHLDRQTGGLSRAIDRGTTGIENVLRLAVFNIVPTLLEVALVTAMLWRLFDWRYALVTCWRSRCYLCLHVRLHQLAGALPPRDERDRQRGEDQGARQPAELRDGQVFRQRGARGAPLRRRAGALRACRGAQPGDAEHAEPRPGGDHRDRRSRW